MQLKKGWGAVGWDDRSKSGGMMEEGRMEKSSGLG